MSALILFDDATARRWRPFTLTRPAGELLFGARTLRSRAEQAYGLRCSGHVAEPALAAFNEPWAPPVVGPDAVPDDAVLLSSRFVAEAAALPEGPALLVCDDAAVGYVPGPGGPRPGPDFFLEPDGAAPRVRRHDVPGTRLGHVWELMTGNAERLRRDLRDPAGAERPSAPGVHVVGREALSIGPDVVLDPGVVLDVRDGPIRIEGGAVLRPSTHLTGPAWIGPGTTLLGGRFEAVSFGPVCKLRGEIEETVVLGYSNKAHDGFLGHAYLGAWVNLGALTTNSDLKNNYGDVRLWTPDGERDTGERKIGCFIGDHVKTAIGTMLNTGTVVEAASNIFGGMPPKYVPPFSWGSPDADYDVDRFLETAAVVMGRRGVELTDRRRELLRSAYRARDEGRDGASAG